MIWLLCLLPLFTYAQDYATKSLTVGTRSSYFTDNGETDNTFLYYIPEYQDETFGEKIGMRKKFKLRVFDYTQSDEEVIVDPLDVSLEFFSDENTFQMGFLRYRFSETFGLQLLDVANPRDYSEFVFNDLSWSKRSVFGMNDTFKVGNLQWQFILTLWPNGDRMPYKGTAFDPTEGRIAYEGGVVERPWFRDLEYGTRMKYLFENGLDLSLLYFHHFSRPTLQQIIVKSPFDIRTKNTDHLVDSLGTSASYVLDEWVVRADALYTINDLVQETLLEFEKEDHFQTLFGIDKNFEKFVLGFQFQSDYSADRHFLGIRSEYSDIEWWKPSAMVFRNVESSDQWFQLKSMFEWRAWKMSVSYDGIHGGREEGDLFGLYRTKDRFLMDASFTY